jgi:hypothetical protein
MLYKKRLIAIKHETTPGTAIALANGDASFNAYDISITPNITVEEHMKQNGFDRNAGVAGARMGTVTFKTHIAATDGAVPTWASVCLPACGWKNSSGLFEPIAEDPGTNAKTVTIGVYAAGKLLSIYGAMGTFRMVFPNGRTAYTEWTFTGKWAAVTDTALLTPTYPTDASIRYATATTTFNSVALCVESLTLDAGNTVVMRECATDATGFHTALVTDRYSKLTANPESALVASRNPHGQLVAGTEAAFALSMSYGTDSLVYSALNAQVLSVGDGDRNGIMIDDIEFGLNTSFSIEFGA